jgi:dTDP-4-amino-4,6-dideoxygalactose transaminase
MDNIHAAILDIKLKCVPEWIQRRRELAQVYNSHLADVRDLVLPPPPTTDDQFDVFQNYEIEAEQRDQLRAHLHESGVETLLPWGGKGVHQFRSLGLAPISLPRTELLFRRALLLPMHCELTDEQVVYVCDCIHRFYARQPVRLDAIAATSVY